MPDFAAWLNRLQETPWLATTVFLAGLLLLAFAADWLTKRVLLRLVSRAVAASPTRYDDALLGRGVISRLAHVVPALVIYLGIPHVPGIPDALATVTRNVANAYMILTVALAFGHLLNALGDIYDAADPVRARNKPIKGYLQLVKIIVFILTGILVLAVLIDRSPLLLLSGLGAMTAVLLLVFKDTILSFVACVQLSSQRHAAGRGLDRDAGAQRRRRRDRYRPAHGQGAELGQDHHHHSDMAADQRELQELARHVRVGRPTHQARPAHRPGLDPLSHRRGTEPAAPLRAHRRVPGTQARGAGSL